MATKQRILIVSRSGDAARSIQRLLELEHAFSIETRTLEGRPSDPLRGARAPDLVLLHTSPGSTPELEALAARPAAERPPLIVIGSAEDADIMRAAMRAGARDFLPEPVSEEELKASIGPILAERAVAPRPRKSCQMAAFLNAKGGSGATFLACNVAHLLADVSDLDTVLVDLDFQFGALPRYLDLEPKRSLLEALDVADDLDVAAIDAYLTRHESGLAVFSGTAEGAAPQQDMMSMVDRFESVLALLSDAFERVVIDVPRYIESCSAAVLERADTVVLVLQQSVPSLHDATRMYEFLTRSLAVPPDRILGVVNRYHKAAAVELADIEHALGVRELLCVPNDFRAVAESINVGVPMREYAKRSPVTRALLAIEKQLGGRETAVSRHLIPLLRKTG